MDHSKSYVDREVNILLIAPDGRSTDHTGMDAKKEFAKRLDEAVRLAGVDSRTALVQKIGDVESPKQTAGQWVDRLSVPHKYRKPLEDLGISIDYINSGDGALRLSPASQSMGMDEAIMAQGLELLYLMADARPEDKKLQRPTWAMIRAAASAIQKAKGSQREAMAEILAELSKERA